MLEDVDVSAPSRVAVTLLLDREAVRLAEVLVENDVPSLLLKGPVIQRWLYGHQWRPYGDIDLLVPSSKWSRALSVLRDCGYIDPIPGARGIEVSAHARPLVSTAGCVVDLHSRLNGTHASETVVWEALYEHRLEMRLAGGTVYVCDQIGKLLIVVLHAAQHGITEAKPIEDLRRASSIVSATEVREAARLAGDLGAGESFAAGLLLDPVLRGLVPELAVAPVSLLVKVRAAGKLESPGLRVLVSASTGSWIVRLAIVGRALWPSRDFLSIRMGPYVKSGPLWIARARLSRWLYQLRKLRGAITEFRRIRKHD